jgi:putative NADPH-quinone reductase
MKHLIVVAHASEDSFTMELARAYRAHELAPVSTENPVSPFQDAHICA